MTVLVKHDHILLCVLFSPISSEERRKITAVTIVRR